MARSGSVQPVSVLSNRKQNKEKTLVKSYRPVIVLNSERFQTFPLRIPDFFQHFFTFPNQASSPNDLVKPDSKFHSSRSLIILPKVLGICLKILLPYQKTFFLESLK